MCTSFQLKNKDASVVVGRTMEFGVPVNWDLRIVPRGIAQQGNAPDGPGAKWTVKYGYVGISPGYTKVGSVESPAHEGVADGVNEAGLWCGLLYLPSFAVYQDPTGVPADKLIGPLSMANFVLAQAATADEAVKLLEGVTVWAEQYPPIGTHPLHVVLHDKSGASKLVEYTAEGRNVYDVPLGVVTNSPPFPWHEINLRNYVNVTATDVPPRKADGQTLPALGEGSGMLGLPGDFTPPSRFIRATALANFVYQSDDAAEGVRTALHILGSFDIPKGSVRNPKPEGLAVPEATLEAMKIGEFTDWSSVAELCDAPAYTLKTYDDVTPKRLALSDGLLTGDAVKVVSVMGVGAVAEWRA